MNELDRNISSLLSALSALVNQASRAEATSAEAIRTVKVPLGLLCKARQLCKEWAETEYTSEALRHASKREF